MNLSCVQRILGLLLMLFSFSMLPPVGVSYYYDDGNYQPFLDAFVSLLLIGSAVWFPVRRSVRELRLRDGFLVVALFWVVLGLAGAAPLVLSDRTHMPITDAVFESVSGFTTTGATVLVGLDSLPRSIVYFRHQTQWLGGIGMVVLAVALLPMLGVGGMQLLRAETPGPVKDAKITPRITETAKVLWVVYVTMTLACAGAYWIAGMPLFEAVGHSFSTVSTGGFSNHDANLAYFDNAGIELIAVLFMLLGSVNFALHFAAWRQRSVFAYLRDSEFRIYLLTLAGCSTLYVLALLVAATVQDPWLALRRAVVQAVSMQSSTGFTTDNFALWPGALPFLLMISTFLGGCAGSTAGGMKVIRWLLIWQQGRREIMRLVHPSAELPVKVGGKPASVRIIESVWGFFAVYVLCFVMLMLLLMAVGTDQVTAFSAIATCINNAGPALGAVSSNFSALSDGGKWICVVAMLLGRLEIFPLLVLISPTFWRG